MPNANLHLYAAEEVLHDASCQLKRCQLAPSWYAAPLPAGAGAMLVASRSVTARMLASLRAWSPQSHAADAVVALLGHVEKVALGI